ncbi:OmpA family protein [Campylobacter sp. JMF_04 NA10]|uniref:OmpA family protein n=1 Tax=Campylobacter sp. JMF_04 NA10 TaxID=2983824 RepID=UPI0022E9A2DE|nr:OmpA family protein [Campylobacter sp. JMF_04 NA10]MDA3076495.1 OmpA family protein [Campylobacter sp. JMF_04 NA10]
MKSKTSEKETFWIAYADLMAGLLFVFILLIGGIIVKYYLVQDDLKAQTIEHEKAMVALQSSQKKSAELEALNKIFSEQLEKLNVENTDLRKQNSIYFIQIEDLSAMAEKLKKENFDISELLKNTRTEATEKEIKIAFLLDQLTQKESDFNKILHDLNVTKNRIRNLTGQKVKLIAELKERLGGKIRIDSESGAMTLNSSVLFDKGSSELKESSKESFKTALEGYFSALMDNDEIRNSLDQIIIEGHTDSDGGYLYNLALSQERALAVMNFINEWNKDERLQKYLIASGRSYSQPVLTDGVEDKDASRRIEIKFTLSNKEAMEEIRKFLEFDTNATR